MALYQRNGIYYLNISVPGRKPIRHSTGTRDRAKAQEYHDQKKAELWKVTRLGEKPQRTWDEAAVKWLQEKQGKASYAEDVRMIRWFTQYFRGVPLNKITREWVDALLTEKKGHVSPRTRDLHVAVVRGILRRAMREWEWIDHVPAFRTYERKGKGRVRWLTQEQVQVLLQELPHHTRAAMLFSLNTGLRMSNVLGLKWADVDLDRRVAHVEKTKNDDPLTVPLNQQALALLESLKGQHSTHVFSYKGQPLLRVNTRAWRDALKRAGIANFRWHDLRHTWASWLRQNGVPTWALQQLAGWKTPLMADRYAHIAVDHLAPYSELVGTVLCTPTVSGSSEDGAIGAN